MTRLGSQNVTDSVQVTALSEMGGGGYLIFEVFAIICYNGSKRFFCILSAEEG